MDRRHSRHSHDARKYVAIKKRFPDTYTNRPRLTRAFPWRTRWKPAFRDRRHARRRLT